MPELPEVEIIRLQLDKALKGLVVEEIKVLREKSFMGDVGAVRGVRVAGVRRRAKVILIDLGDRVGPCQLVLAIHLKMTGQLILRQQNQKSKFKNQNAKLQIKIQKDGPYETKELPNKYTRVIISFSNGSRLFFNDLRVFGWIRIINSNIKTQISNTNSKFKTQNDVDLDKYGPEAIDEGTFTSEYFRKMLGKTSRAVKLAILDQEKLAGVGNIYANEALFRAGIDPTKPAKELRKEESEKLRKEIISILREAIEHGGTSDKDEAFRQIDGSKGGYQKFLKVYNREGKPCLKCGQPILKMKIGGRGSYYCPECQK